MQGSRAHCSSLASIWPLSVQSGPRDGSYKAHHVFVPGLASFRLSCPSMDSDIRNGIRNHDGGATKNVALRCAIPSYDWQTSSGSASSQRAH